MMRKSKPILSPVRWLLIIVSTLLGLLWLYSSAVNNHTPTPTADHLPWKTLRIGYAIEPPYAFKDPQQRVTGESPESARQIARRFGIEDIQWVELAFNQLIPALRNRQIDMIAAGLFISRQRQQHVRFSVPALQVYPGLLARADKAPNISSDLLENINAGLRFVVMAGSVEAANLAQLDLPVNSLTVSDLTAAIDSLNNDASDALLLSLPTLKLLANRQTNFRVIELNTEAIQRLSADYVAFAFNRKDSELFTAWNRAMQPWVGSDSHIQTIRPFGFDWHDIVAPDGH